MRLDRFTSKFQLAISDAQSLALGRDHQFIEPVHLMSAMLNQDAASLRPLLVEAGIEGSALRSQLSQALEQLPRVEGTGGEVQLSNQLVVLLNLCDKLAQKRKDKFISSEIFFLAVTEDKGKLGDIMRELGATKQNIEKANVLAGSSNFSLSVLGHEKMTKRLATIPALDHLISSPLKRCAQVAEEFAKQKQLSLNLAPQLKEMHFGDWDGQSFENLWQQTPNSSDCTIGDFWQNPWQNTPPNGESMQAFTERVRRWWQQWLEARFVGNTLVISHAGVIKHLLALIIGIDVKQNQQLNVFDIPYAGVIRIDVYFDENNQAWPKVVF